MPAAALGCQCEGMTISEGVSSADIVLAGIVSARERVGTIGPMNDMARWEVVDSMDKRLNVFMYRYTVSVARVYKGDTTSKAVIVYSPVNGATCGFKFNVGDKYMIFADKRKAAAGDRLSFYTTQCHLTNEFDAGLERLVIGAVKR